MRIEKVTGTDQICIAAGLAHEIWHEHYTPIIGREQVEYMLGKFQSEEAIANQIAEGYLYFLLTHEEKPVGYLSVLPKDKELFLSKIYVRSEERGRGFGRAGITFLESLARERGMSKISLTVNKNNVLALNAYERYGFINTGPTVADIGSGFVMDDYKLVLML